MNSIEVGQIVEKYTSTKSTKLDSTIAIQDATALAIEIVRLRTELHRIRNEFQGHMDDVDQERAECAELCEHKYGCPRAAAAIRARGEQ